jgi:acyl-CoA thioesterase-1
MQRLISFLLCLALLATLSCAPTPDAASAPDVEKAARPAPSESADAVADQRTLIVFLGDSLTAGYGLNEDEAFPAIAAQLLDAEDRSVRIVNAGVSGDTTAGGLRRLDWLLKQAPDILVVCLGANDGLRALDVEQSEENLRQIIAGARAAGVQVLLAGMLVPPNYGPEYAERFAAVYPRLAAQSHVAFLPFLLEGVAAMPELNQADGIHPNAEGQRRVAELVAAHLTPLVDAVAAAKGFQTP